MASRLPEIRLLSIEKMAQYNLILSHIVAQRIRNMHIRVPAASGSSLWGEAASRLALPSLTSLKTSPRPLTRSLSPLKIARLTNSKNLRKLINLIRTETTMELLKVQASRRYMSEIQLRKPQSLKQPKKHLDSADSTVL